MQPIPSLFPREAVTKVYKSISLVHEEIFAGHGLFMEQEIPNFVREHETKRRNREDAKIAKAKDMMTTSLNVHIPTIQATISSNCQAVVDLASGLQGSIQNLLSQEQRFQSLQENDVTQFKAAHIATMETVMREVASHRDDVDQEIEKALRSAYSQYGFSYPDGRDLLNEASQSSPIQPTNHASKDESKEDVHEDQSTPSSLETNTNSSPQTATSEQNDA
eukprot:TRINITY_DN6988_c0_g1_i2.p1 TRINITY_DN6988_c0_g1~~TRINITY_DN6988_c0_g1_i2.p1  ORF type:complete len:220 (-),score=64.35 TRINITY_DN6988_c0_g1_i2:96-755(-)